MRIDVTYQNKKLGSLDSSSITAFVHFCHSEGYVLDWDVKNQKLHLKSGISEQTISFIHEENEDDEEGDALRKDIKSLLAATGIRIKDVKTKTSLPQNNLSLRVSFITFEEDITTPFIEVGCHLSPKQKKLKTMLQHHLEAFELQHAFIKHKIDAKQPYLTLHCKIPAQYNKEDWQLVRQKIALSIAVGVSQFLCSSLGKQPSALSEMPLHSFFKENVVSNTSQNQSHMKKQAKNKNVTTQAKPNAEVYFNYTVHTPNSKGQFSVTGDLNIKNTGTVDLENPLICMKVQPTESINLGGQIIPPSMADTLSVQSAGGLQGWKFMDDDWFKQARERGEYWIGPVQTLRIPPNETAALSNFQLTIDQLDKQETAVIRSVVYVQDKNTSFTADNDIKLSF
ncbi:hypothetical protein SAMN05192534_12516 [Alteribacillus persepolensis]|uniref:Uncharacterized protein n=1 Tax=Alteribacillus persepolensis TaxID=568899 RepID=A0A1G8IQ56_9BACI|nr:hypothetical protein [Alteribacillus persepolensis]SDI20982.1 hypothetical protein SAMN05192534_12516 [Alteribacillus persepolensis]